jgi:outer membrane protein
LKTKSIFLLGTVLACSLLGPAAMAAGVGYVDTERVLAESEQAKAAEKKLETEFKRRQSDLVDKGKQLQKLAEKLERDGAIMSDSERQRLERDIVSRRRKIKNAEAEFNDDLSIRKREALKSIHQKMAEVIKQVAKAEGYDLIIFSGVAYSSDKVDISDKVLDRLNSDFRSSR